MEEKNCNSILRERGIIKLNNHKLETQIGREELKNCKACGATMLKYVDFDTNKNSEICINCKNIDIRHKSVVNASYLPFYYQQEQTTATKEPITITAAASVEPDIFYKSSGKPSDNKIQRYYNKQEQNIKQIISDIKPTITSNNALIQGAEIKINWDKIIGYEPIKFAITQTLNIKGRKKQTHMLIVGAAGTSKTVFLKVLEENLQAQGLNVHYLDATTLSSSGVIDYLFTHDVKYCLLDEIDKLEREHQRTFLNLLESGLLQETKSKKNGTRKKEMKDTLFIATGNYIDKIMHPLLTRFMTFKIPEYTKEQFHEIGIKLLNEQYGKTKEIAAYIVSRIWEIYTDIRHEKPNLRYARDIANLTDNDKSKIDLLLEAQIKYSESYEE